MNFPELEEKILKNWREIQAFKKSVENRSKDRSFVFYEGPPTANGMPGFHHVEARSYKDIVCRYKTMRGFHVERRAGWDTHGLPVEIQVEKELGLNSKKDIEKYGIAEFNAKCRESVWRYQKEWEELTERMGFWIDMENPYITLDPLYMESLWWIMKQAYEKELLYEGHKVVPRCMRCGTALSSHEVAQGYKDVTDQSVYIKFKLRDPEAFSKLKLEEVEPKIYFLAWTTTPWTLPGNVALAVGKDIKYSVVRQDGEYYVLATELLEILEDEYDVLSEIKGKDLVGLEYEPLFDIKELRSETSHKVYVADFVSTEDGTGIVHTAVMYGEDDYQLGKEFGLPTVHTVDEAGNFNEFVKEFEGRNVKEAEKDIIKYLEKSNLLYKVQPYEHSYPFCWRCSEPLLYYATDSWFIGMSSLKDDLIKANNKINWIPEHIKEGRFGEWLRNVKDWAFSRSRYWGTPLPVWKCEECEHVDVVGSRDDLAKLTKGKNEYWLMRHGHSENNEAQILISDTTKKHPLDTLSKKGVEQVKESIEQLKKEGGVDIVVTSPLGRTSETAQMVGEALGVDVITEDLLKEIGVGIYEGKSEQGYSDYFKGEKNYNFTKGAPKGETLAGVRKRMLEAISALEEKYSGKKILLVSHGHPLWVLEASLGGLTINEGVEWKRKGEYPQNAQLRRVEYAKFPYNNEGELDFHRPFVDDIEFLCKACGKNMRRVEDLVDVWFDSGSMPFAQQHYPFENKDTIDKNTAYPADYITEAMDQTRGWFYTMLAVSVILGKAPSYKNVITLGIVLDDNGQKMSKSKGNIIDPKELASKYGMDAVRWYFFTVNQPGDAKLFSEQDVKERWQRFLSTFANSYTFLNTYAPDVKPSDDFSAKTSKNVLDQWIFAKLKEVNEKVVRCIDDYNILDAARALEEFVVEDVSNWYIRRSRERLQRPETKDEKDEASDTLAFILNETSKMTAPFIPFVSEHIWQGLNKTGNESVHWEDYPEYEKFSKKDEEVVAVMRDIRSWSQVALRLRSDNGLKVRQPLEVLAVPKDISDELKNILKDEINVKDVVSFSDVQTESSDWVVEGKIALKVTFSEALAVEGQAREMMRHIQNMRRKLGLKPADKIQVEYSLGSELAGKLLKYEEEMSKTTSSDVAEISNVEDRAYDMFSEYNWDPKHKVRVGIKKL
ncbi:MAG: class I tRNA ligase family protein [Candidatus Spechtbacterales bacterium]